MNSKTKKIFIGVGVPVAAVSIVSTLVFVFLKNDDSSKEKDSLPASNQIEPKSEPDKATKDPLVESEKESIHYKDDEVRSKIFELFQMIKPLVSSKEIPLKNLEQLFINKNKQDVTTLLISNLLKNGIKNIDINNVQLILDNFNVSKKISQIAKSLFLTSDNKINHELIDILFNHGISKINMPKYQDQKDNIIKIAKQFIPSSVTKIISYEELEKIVFTGFSETDFKNLLTRIIDQQVGFGGSFATLFLSEGIKEIYSFLPIIKNGIINASPQDWIQTFRHFKDIINYKLSGYDLWTFVHQDKKGIQNKWQTANIIKNIANQISNLASSKDESKKTELDTIAEALSNIFNKGLNSLNEKQSLQISNIIEWSLNFKQGKIYKADLAKFKEGVKDLFKNLINGERESFDFRKIDNAKNIDEVASAVKLIEAYENPKAKQISHKEFYTSIGNSRISKKEITDDEGTIWTYRGLKTSIGKILNKYYDKNKETLSENIESIEDIFKHFENDNSVNDNNAYIYWDKIIDQASLIQTFDKEGNKVIIDWKKEFKTLVDEDSSWNSYTYAPFDYYNSFAESIINEFLKNKYYLSSDPNINDEVTFKTFEKEIKTFKVKPILDKIDSLFKNGLYKNKISENKVDINNKVETYLKENINSYRFHQRKQSTINEYLTQVKNSLKLYKTKTLISDLTANQELDLSTLDDNNLEGVQQIYDAAKNIIENAKNGIWDAEGTKQDLSNNEAFKLIIPQIPLQDYAYELNKNILNKKIEDSNSVDTKIINFVLNHIKPISNFLLNGYPKTEENAKVFDQTIKEITYFVGELLNIKNIDSYYNFVKVFIDPIFEIIKKEHLKLLSN